MLLTPSVLIKLNKRYKWGLCSDGMCEFIEAYPDGVEVTMENYRKIRRRFGYAIDNLAEQSQFDDAQEEYENNEGYTDTRFHADKFLEIFNKLIVALDKKPVAKKAAAKKTAEQ